MSKIAQKSKKTHQNLDHRVKKGTKNGGKILCFAIISAVFTLFLSAFLMAFLLEKSPDPTFFIPFAAMFCTAFASAVSGVVAARLSGAVAPFSVLSGLCMILIYLAVSLFFESEDTGAGVAFKTATVLILPCVSFFAACLFGNRSKGARKR